MVYILAPCGRRPALLLEQPVVEEPVRAESRRLLGAPRSALPLDGQPVRAPTAVVLLAQGGRAGCGRAARTCHPPKGAPETLRAVPADHPRSGPGPLGPHPPPEPHRRASPERGPPGPCGAAPRGGARLLGRRARRGHPRGGCAGLRHERRDLRARLLRVARPGAGRQLAGPAFGGAGPQLPRLAHRRLASDVWQEAVRGPGGAVPALRLRVARAQPDGRLRLRAGGRGGPVGVGPAPASRGRREALGSLRVHTPAPAHRASRSLAELRIGFCPVQKMDGRRRTASFHGWGPADILRIDV
mmetsp:Transcript_17874/g.47185  ORF Transcript_17874/g.47185 Transcript_17874/m.47185 type:complete len:300 (+) Transcript_17874:402-1301(+)